MNEATDIQKEVRIDKWLWAVRIYKTRSQASEECRKGKVIIDGIQVKPSRIVKKGEVISIRKLPVIYTFKVLEMLNSRVAAKLVTNYCIDITPEEELLKLKLDELAGVVRRERGTGRPTKKERRDIDKLRS